MATKKINWIIPLVFMVLCFLTQKEILPLSVYMFVSFVAAFYFIPVRLIVLVKRTNENQLSTQILYGISNVLFASILGLSAVYLYLEESRMFKTIIEIFGIILFVEALYYIIKKKDTFNFMLHFFFSSFTPFIIIG
jgi:hypothetical protein